MPECKSLFPLSYTNLLDMADIVHTGSMQGLNNCQRDRQLDPRQQKPGHRHRVWDRRALAPLNPKLHNPAVPTTSAAKAHATHAATAHAARMGGRPHATPRSVDERRAITARTRRRRRGTKQFRRRPVGRIPTAASTAWVYTTECTVCIA